MTSALPDLQSFLHPSRVVTVPASTNKAQTLRVVADSFLNHNFIGNHSAWVRALHDREEVTSTGIGGGVALPHAQHSSISDFVLAIGLAPCGIAFSAKDNLPVRLLIMMAAPIDDRPYYLKVLASIAARIHRRQTIESMLAATSPEAVIAAFNQAL